MTKEEGLRAYLDEFIYRGFAQDDFIPSFFPGCKTSTIPSMFGAKEIIAGDDVKGERILFKPEDIDSLPEPTISPNTPAHNWLEMQKYYIEECEGEIPVHVCDMQGPMDVCGQLYGYEGLFLCAYDDEERYVKLMQKAADAFQLLWEAQATLLGDKFVGTHLFGWSWIPENVGATMSVDSLVMLSKDFFDEFYKPYIEDIAKRFGGITVHSCGNFGTVVENLAKTDDVRAINASQMSVTELLDNGWNPSKLMIVCEEANNLPTLFNLAREKNLFLDPTVGGIWPDDKPQNWTNEQKNAIIEKINYLQQCAAT